MYHLRSRPRKMSSQEEAVLGSMLAGARANMWGFLTKMGVPPNHPISIGFSIRNHPFGYPYFRKTSIFFTGHRYMGFFQGSSPHECGDIWGRVMPLISQVLRMNIIDSRKHDLDMAGVSPGGKIIMWIFESPVLMGDVIEILQRGAL